MTLISTYLTPGVYRTPQVAPQPSLQLVRTDIAGFVGIAERGPLPEDFPADKFDGTQAVLKISSWKQFLANFGGFHPYSYLAYSARAFFENGGQDCYVARVAATTATDPAQWPAKAFFCLPSGAPVPIGSVNQIAGPFQCTFTLTGNRAPSAGDLLMIQGGGVTQLVPVAGVLSNGQALTASALSPQIAAGATVSSVPAACVISAASRGNWGNDILVQITPTSPSTFALRATVVLGPNTLPAEDEYYRSLTLSDPASYNYAPTVLAQQSNLIRLDVLGQGSIALQAVPQLANGVFYLQGGRDGLSAVTLRDFRGGPNDLRGFAFWKRSSKLPSWRFPTPYFRFQSLRPHHPRPLRMNVSLRFRPRCRHRQSRMIPLPRSPR